MKFTELISNITGRVEAEKDSGKRKIAHHVFGGSTTMIGVCITIIALFKTSNTGKSTSADEILGVNTFIFITAAMLSYLSLRKNDDAKLEWWADVLFFIGMSLMLVVGFIIVFTDL